MPIGVLISRVSRQPSMSVPKSSVEAGQPAAEQQADRRAGAGHGGVHRERAVAGRSGGERRGDQGQRGGGGERGAEALQATGGEQRALAGGEATEQRRRRRR